MKKLLTALFVLVLFTITFAADEWHIETVDSEGSVGSYTSLAIDSFGYPHISYQADTGLKYARWDGADWQIEIVGSGGGCQDKSLVLDSSDYPHISYSAGVDLKYARWDGSSWLIETVDSAGDACSHTSLALDSSGYPHISYCISVSFIWFYSYLKYARWDGTNWHIETVDSGGNYDYVGQYNSLALDSSDYPHISYYYVSYLKYARWDGSSWRIETVDPEGDVGECTSIALDSGDNPHISYYDGYANYDLKYARFDGSSWHIETVDSEGWVGWYTSIALDSGDHPHVSYYDWSNGNLKYAWYESGPGVEDAELFADIRDEGVLISWEITGDVPASLRILRSVGEGESVAIHDNPLPGSATSYLDQKDKGFQPLAAGIEYVYWLEVTEADGTVSRFGPTEAVSIPEQTTRLALGEPYPSPARDAVTIRYELPNGCSGAVIEVYDLSGRRIDSFPLTDSGEITIEVSDYASGVYTAQLSTDEGSVSRRLVITR